MQTVLIILVNFFFSAISTVKSCEIPLTVINGGSLRSLGIVTSQPRTQDHFTDVHSDDVSFYVSEMSLGRRLHCDQIIPQITISSNEHGEDLLAAIYVGNFQFYLFNHFIAVTT